MEFGHTLEDQIGGQIEVGFVVAGFYEDADPNDEWDVLGKYMGTYLATRALKTRDPSSASGRGAIRSGTTDWLTRLARSQPVSRPDSG